MQFLRIRVHKIILIAPIFVIWLVLVRFPKNHLQDEQKVEKSRSNCLKLRLPNNESKYRVSKLKFLPALKVYLNENSYVDHWQRANLITADDKLLVFSAYFDGRTADTCVRVIGARLTRKAPDAYCKLSFNDDDSEIVDANVRIINEHQNLKYTAVYFNCCFKRANSVPRMVSISNKKDFRHSAQMPVHHNQKSYHNSTSQFAVCVKPFHYEYNRATWLLEFLEYNRMMGVEHFFFYNHTVGPDLQLVLNAFVSMGLATVLPWDLDLVSQKEIRTEGIFAALNDCLYRAMFRYKYVVMVDFDEYIVPHLATNYSSLIQEILDSPSVVHRRKTSKFVASSYIFKNVFFYLYWANDTTAYGDVPESDETNIPYLLTQYKTRRLKKATERGRTKYIVHPEGTLEVGNHQVWREISGFGRIRVEESIAIMHHYRICEFGGYDCLKHPSVIDRTAHKFSNVLLSRILDQCRNIFPNLDGICPISPPLGSPW